VDCLREVAQGRDDIRVECAGTIAGSWFASGARRGEDLVAAGLLMLAGPVDLDQLDHWVKTSCERRAARRQLSAIMVRCLAAPTITTPAKLNETAAMVMRILASAVAAYTQIEAAKHL
jgi:hypothetical protein